MGVYDGCIDLVIVSLIMGVIKSVISGLAVVAIVCEVINIYLSSLLFFDFIGRSIKELSFAELLSVLFPSWCIPAVMLHSLLGFIFAVLLCYGASKVKPGYLKAYFVYGYFETLTLLMASILLYVWDRKRHSAVAQGLCIMSIIMTIVVFKAYIKITMSLNNMVSALRNIKIAGVKSPLKLKNQSYISKL